MPGKCSFNHKWLTMEEYKWVRQVKGDSKKAICIVCNKTIALTSMGESALRSHMAGSKHQVNVKSNGTASTMKPFLQRKTSDDQKSTCTATVNQEKVGTSSPDEDMPMNIPLPPPRMLQHRLGNQFPSFSAEMMYSSLRYCGL